MDIYSNWRVPFEIGVWARGHKFHPTAVQINRDLKSIANIQQQQKELEWQLAEAEKALAGTIEQAAILLKESDNAH